MINRSKTKTLREYNDSPGFGSIANNLLVFLFEYHKHGMGGTRETTFRKTHAATTAPFMRSQSKSSIWLYIVRQHVWFGVPLGDKRVTEISTKVSY